VAVLSPNRLDRSCTAAELSRAEGVAAEACEQLPAFLEKSCPDLVVLQDVHSPRDMSWLAEQLDTITSYCAETVTIVLGHQAEPALRLCLDAGVRAHLPPDASSGEVICAIRMSHRGMLVYPAAMLRGIATGWSLLTQPLTSGVGGAGLDPADFAELTPRQVEVVRLVAAGLPNKGIARQMAISESTVKVHLRAVMRRVGASSRMQIAAHYRATTVGESG
jgi:DNA-binding NarL/FixJ family response regulator